MLRRPLTPTTIRAPFGRYHHGVAVENPRRLVFLSGQLGIAPDGSIPEDVGEQTRLCLANIEACLALEGMDRSHVVRLSTFLIEPADRTAYMAVRDAWVSDPPPASTLLFIKALAQPAFKIEIEAIAAAG